MRGFTRALGVCSVALLLAASAQADVVNGKPAANLIASFDGNNNVSFTSGQTQWCAGWGGEGPAAYITSPNTKGFVVIPGAHPWVGLKAKDAASCAVYVDISGVDASSQSKFIAVFGNVEGHIALMKTGANTVQVWQNKAVITGTSENEATPAPTLSVESSALASGYHLIVFGYSASGAFLSVDGTTTVSVEATLPKPNDGFQIGSIYQGLNTWTSGPSVAQGYGIKIDEVRGYTGTLSEADISALATALRASTIATADLATATVATYGSLTWSPASAPTENGYAKIIAGAGTALTMDTATPALAELTISGGALTVKPGDALAEETAAVSASQALIQANADLSAVTASLGGVYIWADKRLTVRSLSHLGATPSVSGTGTSAALAVKLATAETAETLGYQPRNTFVLAQGKLSIEGGKLANASTIRVEGTGSRMICTANDPMNSGNTYAGKLELADGAILETQMHTRLPQTVEVSGTGSQVQITGTNGNDWRAVSLRTVNLNENATATFKRARDKATSNEAGFHLWNTTVNAAAGATLTIDAPLMKGCNNLGLNNNETSLTKTGAGELIVTAPSVASGFKLPGCTIAVNAGTMTLKPAAGTTPDFGSASITVASGAELAYAGEGASTVSTAVSGAGALKAKSGTVAFSNLSGFTGTATASAGTLDLHGATFGETLPTFAVESGATLILPASTEGAITVPSGATLTLVLSQSQVFSGYATTASGSVTFKKVAADGTLADIPESEGSASNGTFTPSLNIWTATEATDGNYLWSNRANWSKGRVPLAGDSVCISASGETTLTLTEAATVAALSVTGTGTLTIAGAKLTVTNGAILSANVTLASDTLAAGSVQIEAEKTLTVTMLASVGNIVNNGTLVVDGGSESLTYANTISGSGSLTKRGAGNLLLSASAGNTYSGGTRIEAGRIGFANGSSLGTGEITFVPAALSTAGLWHWAGNDVELANTITFGGEGTCQLYIPYSRTLSVGGTVGGSGTVELTHGDTTGTGTLLFSNAAVAACTYTGTWTIPNGTMLRLGNASAGGTNALAEGSTCSAGSEIIVEAGGTLNFNPWTGTSRDKSGDGKVTLTTKVTLKGGTLTMPDGSYVYNALNVTAASTVAATHNKGIVFKTFYGTGDLTVKSLASSYGSPIFAFWCPNAAGSGDGVEYTGKMTFKNEAGGNPIMQVYPNEEASFKQAYLHFEGSNAIEMLMGGNRWVGALDGNAQVTIKSSDSTNRTLTVGTDYTGTAANAPFAGTIADSVNLTLAANVAQTITGSLGTVTDGVASYGRAVTLNAGSELKLQSTVAQTITAAITGDGALTIGDGTNASAVTLTGNNSYTGGTTVKSASTLTVNGATTETKPLPDCSYDAAQKTYSSKTTVETGATVQLLSGMSYAYIEGQGTVEVTGDFVFGQGSNQSGIAVPVTVAEGKTLAIRNFREDEAFNLPSLTLNASSTVKQDIFSNEWTKSASLSITKTLAGTGTISVPVTFADGAEVDARSETGTAYATLSNTMTLPATGTVKVKANNYGIVLNAAGLTVEKFALTDGGSLSEGVFSIVGDYLYLVQKPTVPAGTDSSVAEAIARAALQSGAFFTQVTEASAATGCLVDGAALFDNVVTFSAVGSSMTEATALVQYDFGVSNLTISTLQTPIDGGRLTVGTRYVLVCATVSNNADLAQNTARYATGTALTLLNETTPLTGVVEPTVDEIAALRLTTPAGSRWLAVPMTTLFPVDGKTGTAATGTIKLKVKANK